VNLDELRQRPTLTVEEAGRLLGISRGVAYHAARDGELPVLRFGRRLLVPVPRLLAMLGENGDGTREGGGKWPDQSHG
jgi:excisionase family DNA binding protein